MTRKILILFAFLVGVLIGSCAVLPGRGGPAGVEVAGDWRPVPGRRYDRPGRGSRVVAEVWAGGVGWHHPGEDRRHQCEIGTWKRWATGR